MATPFKADKNRDGSTKGLADFKAWHNLRNDLPNDDLGVDKENKWEQNDGIANRHWMIELAYQVLPLFTTPRNLT